MIALPKIERLDKKARLSAGFPFGVIPPIGGVI